MLGSFVVFIYIVSIVFCLASLFNFCEEVEKAKESKYSPADLKKLKKIKPPNSKSKLLFVFSMALLPVLNIFIGMIWFEERKELISNALDECDVYLKKGKE